MNVAAAGPETIALSSNIHPSKLNGNQSIAEKTREREEAANSRSDAGEDRGNRIDIEV